MPRDYYHPSNLLWNPTIDEDFSCNHIRSPERVGRFEQPPADEAEAPEPKPGMSQHVLDSIRRAVDDFTWETFLLEGLGERCDHDGVEFTKRKIAEIDSHLSKQLKEIVLAFPPDEIDLHEWQSRQAEKENQRRQETEMKKLPFRAVLQLEEKHEAYSVLLKEAEQKLEKIYSMEAASSEPLPVSDEMNEEVENIL